jgi:hypothetical protein
MELYTSKFPRLPNAFQYLVFLCLFVLGNIFVTFLPWNILPICIHIWFCQNSMSLLDPIYWFLDPILYERSIISLLLWEYWHQNISVFVSISLLISLPRKCCILWRVFSFQIERQSSTRAVCIFPSLNSPLCVSQRKEWKSAKHTICMQHLVSQYLARGFGRSKPPFHRSYTSNWISPAAALASLVWSWASLSLLTYASTWPKSCSRFAFPNISPQEAPDGRPFYFCTL